MPAPIRVALFSALLGGLAVGLYLGYLRHQVALVPPVEIPWYAMAVAFFAAELKVINIHSSTRSARSR